MTLLLTALTSKAIVLGADGAEFRHAPNQPKNLALTYRKKLLHLPGRPLAIGIHGQNRLASPGSSLAEQWLVVERLTNMIHEIDSTASVNQVCHQLISQLTPTVHYTFQALATASIQAAPLGLLVVGFDDDVRRPRCFEAWWSHLSHGFPTVVEHPRDRKLPAIVHSGDGTKYATTAISHGGRYSVDRLKNADIGKTQEFVRALYKKAESLQPRDKIEFTGEYHEITITPDGSSWSGTSKKALDSDGLKGRESN